MSALRSGRAKYFYFGGSILAAAKRRSHVELDSPPAPTVPTELAAPAGHHDDVCLGCIIPLRRANELGLTMELTRSITCT